MAELFPPYAPAPAPNRGEVADLERYVSDELHRVGSWAQQVNPSVGYTVATWSATGVLIDSAPVWTNLFDGSTEIVDIPDGQFDPVTGIWTCLDDGFYNVSAALQVVEPLGTGNRDLAIGLRVVLNGTPGTEWITSGSNEFPINVSAAESVPLLVDDTIVFEGAVYTSNPAGGLVDIGARFNITRLG